MAGVGVRREQPGRGDSLRPYPKGVDLPSPARRQGAGLEQLQTRLPRGPRGDELARAIRRAVVDHPHLRRRRLRQKRFHTIDYVVQLVPDGQEDGGRRSREPGTGKGWSLPPPLLRAQRQPEEAGGDEEGGGKCERQALSSWAARRRPESRAPSPPRPAGGNAPSASWRRSARRRR